MPRLEKRWLDEIDAGRKTCEGRVERGYWATVKVGDVITFSDAEGTREIKVKVVAVRVFDTFREMYSRYGERLLPGVETEDEAHAIYEGIYPEEMGERHPKVAIEIVKV